MRAPPLVSEFFEWRWAPCVGLTAGSLAFVALSLLLIPTSFDSAANAQNAANARDETALLDRSSVAPSRALLGASLPRSFAGIGRAPEQAGLLPARREHPESTEGVRGPTALSARGFSPIIDRPDPPPPPSPVAPPPLPSAPPAVEVAQVPLPASASPPAAIPAPGVVIQQPQQPDADGPRREVTVQ